MADVGDEEYSLKDSSQKSPLLKNVQTDQTLGPKSMIRAGCILAAEFCERLAYYSIDANLVLLFRGMGYETQNANVIALGWKGTGYVTPLFGGYLADNHLGRFKTIILFVSFYVISMACLAVGAEFMDTQQWLVFVSLFLVAICMGGIKANVVTFGADQFLDAPKEVKQTFFNWFYFSINCGSFISFTGIAYIQQEISFTIGLAVPAAVMALSAIFFVAGSKLYVKLLPTGSIMAKCASMIVQCFKSSPEIKASCSGFLDRAKFAKDITGQKMFTDAEVDDLKSLSKIFPIQATFIMFWCLYAQMSSIIFSQGTVMRLKVNDDFSLPVSSLQLFNSLVILILVPLFDRVLYPVLRKNNISFTPLRRIGVGFLLAILGMIYSGGLEVYRLELYKDNYVIIQNLDDKEIEAVDLSIFWQAPGFMFIGAAEVLASITGLEFAYEEAPPSMRSMVQATYLLTTALGNYLGLVLVLFVNLASMDKPWIANNINDGHLDLYFFTLAVLGFLNLYLFMYLASKYKPRATNEIEEEV